MKTNSRKPFMTNIDEFTQEDFKAKCAKEGCPMNVILEKLMNAYVNGRFTFEIVDQWKKNNE